MKHSTIIVFLAVLLFVSVSEAYVYGGSNFGFTGYPKHNCIAPIKPYKPYQFYDQMEVDSYNSKVRYYNIEVERYIQCVSEYVDNANNDIKRIQESIQKAIDEVKKQ